METKTAKVKRLLNEKEYQKALAIVKGFRSWRTKPEHDIVRLASEARANANFYSQLGIDTEKAYEAGKSLLLRVYGEK